LHFYLVNVANQRLAKLVIAHSTPSIQVISSEHGFGSARASSHTERLNTAQSCWKSTRKEIEVGNEHYAIESG